MEAESKWPLPRSDLSLSGNEVHVWCACLNQPDTCAGHMAQTLSADELERAERFHFLQHRDQFIVAHGLLRKLLADYTHIESDRITFEYGKNGKPFLSKNSGGDKIRFNISHSNEYALFAFVFDRDIGVDLEYIKALKDMDEVAEQVFSAKEIAVLRSLPEADKKACFFKFWTRKEAYLKATGEGFSADLDAIDVSSCSDNSSVFVDSEKNVAEKTHWTIQDLRPSLGYAAAFVVEGDSAMHYCWRIPDSFFNYKY
jgi:4'-phosphopantetheinyl transferase